MNTIKLTKRTAASIFFTCFVVFTSGCIRLTQDYPNIKTYSLNAMQEHLAFSGTPISVCFTSFSASPKFLDRFFVYRSSETTYESDFYNQWMTPPAAMINDQMRNWMKSSHLIQFVLNSDTPSNPHYNIGGRVVELYGDYRQPSQPKAVIKLDFVISKNKGEKPTVIFQKTYSELIPMDRISPKALAEGYDKGFNQILAAFEKDVKQQIV